MRYCVKISIRCYQVYNSKILASNKDINLQLKDQNILINEIKDSGPFTLNLRFIVRIDRNAKSIYIYGKFLSQNNMQPTKHQL